MDQRARRPTDARFTHTHARALQAAQGLLLGDGIEAVTHLRVARASGVGRRTVYRHWPTRLELLHDTLAATEFPHPAVTGDLRTDLIAHLAALRTALVAGPLAQVISALNERAAVEPELRPLRDRLSDAGCAALREVLEAAVARDALPGRLDLEAAMAVLEGPLFYRVLIRNERPGPAILPPLVDAFLAAPPLRPR